MTHEEPGRVTIGRGVKKFFHVFHAYLILHKHVSILGIHKLGKKSVWDRG